MDIKQSKKTYIKKTVILTKSQEKSLLKDMIKGEKWTELLVRKIFGKV